MTVENYFEGKLIVLSKPFDNRAKILNFFYFIVFFLMGLAVLTLIISNGTGSVGETLFSIVVIGVCSLAGYRFINKAFQEEKLFVDKNSLTITKSGFFNHHKASYDIKLISNFRHLDMLPVSKHPLAGESFDYFGFQTEQQVINEMHGDNRLAFEYNGKKVEFGNNVYSWDFEKLQMVLHDITGNDFRYTDDSERVFN